MKGKNTLIREENGNRVNGSEVKSKLNGNSIFLPFAGQHIDWNGDIDESLIENASREGCYRSSVIGIYDDEAQGVYISLPPSQVSLGRETGCSIRPVCE